MYKYIMYNIQIQILNKILFSTIRYSNPNLCGHLWPMTIKPNSTIVNKSRNSWKVILVYSRLENFVTVTVWKKIINRIVIVFHPSDNSFIPLLLNFSFLLHMYKYILPDEDFFFNLKFLKTLSDSRNTVEAASQYSY